MFYGNEPLFQQKTLVCDRIVVGFHLCCYFQTVLRDWQQEGPGDFFSSLLSVNQIRAQAYIYSHIYPDSFVYKETLLLALKRKKTRVIENFDSVIETIQNTFPIVFLLISINCRFKYHHSFFLIFR